MGHSVYTHIYAYYSLFYIPTLNATRISEPMVRRYDYPALVIRLNGPNRYFSPAHSVPKSINAEHSPINQETDLLILFHMDGQRTSLGLGFTK